MLDLCVSLFRACAAVVVRLWDWWRQRWIGRSIAPVLTAKITRGVRRALLAVLCRATVDASNMFVVIIIVVVVTAEATNSSTGSVDGSGDGSGDSNAVGRLVG